MEGISKNGFTWITKANVEKLNPIMHAIFYYLNMTKPSSPHLRGFVGHRHISYYVAYFKFPSLFMFCFSIFMWSNISNTY